MLYEVLYLSSSLIVPGLIQKTLSYVSTYHLRKSFDFNALLSERDLHPKDVYPFGDLMVVDAPVSLLVEHFPYLTKKTASFGRPKPRHRLYEWRAKGSIQTFVAYTYMYSNVHMHTFCF